MNRNLGMSAGIFALLAMAFHISSPQGGESGSNAKPTVSAQKSKSGSLPAQASQQEENLIEGPWLATQYFYGSTETALKARLDIDDPKEILACIADAACSSDLLGFFGIGSAENLEFLLATVPDPLHTRLSLFTDSSIQAIQNAANAAGWEFATQWLPWNDHADPEEKDPEERRKQRAVVRRQEKQPGLLIFRGVDGKSEGHTLLVFMVGETPTEGVNKVQFQLARAYSRLIKDTKQDISIMSPTFSGSFESLAEMVEFDRAGSKLKNHYVVRSGTATNLSAARKFQKTVEDFRGTNENATDQIKYFCATLTELGIAPNESALLIEEETSFARGFEYAQCPDSVGGMLTVPLFRFPRDISHLRNVYHETIGATPQTTKTAATPDVDFTLKDPESGEDSVPIYSTAQSPVLQNAVLSAITGTVRARHLRLLDLQATNVLDALFLVSILRQHCPDTRLLIPYPDLLFTQSEQSAQWNGTLALSTYPLFSAARDWTGDPSRALFHSDMNAEGVYNATLLLLGETKALSAYRWIKHPHPPTWLLSLDRSGFLPVRGFQEGTSERWFQDVPRQAPVRFSLPKPPSLWVLGVSVLAVFNIVFGGWIVHLSRRECEHLLSWFAMDPVASDPRSSTQDQGRQLFLFATLLLLSGMECMLLAPLRTGQQDFDWTAAIGLGALSAIFLFGIAILILIKYLRSSSHLAAGVGGLITFFAGLSMWLWLCHGADDAASFGRADFFSLRVIHLGLSSSPVIPILASALALACFAMIQTFRFHLAFNQQPKLPDWNCNMPLDSSVKASYEELKEMFRSVTAGGHDKAYLALGVFVSAAFLFRVDIHLRTVDGMVYDLLFGALQLSAIATLLFTCFQIMVAVRALGRLLVSLNSLPLAASFTRLDVCGGNKPIWVRRFRLQSLDIPVRAATILHDLDLVVSELKPASSIPSLVWRRNYGSALLELLQPGETLTRLERRTRYHALREASMEIAGQLGPRVLMPNWIERPLVGERCGAAPPAGEKSFAGDPKDLFDLAQNFVALTYTSFLMYALRQIQNLLWFLSIGFLLVVISLNSYSFQSPQAIGRFLVFLFLLIGAVLWRCLARLERDPILSRIAGTASGELNAEFYLRLVGYGALPVLGVLTSQFPAVSNFVLSWLQPTLEALH